MQTMKPVPVLFLGVCIAAAQVGPRIAAADEGDLPGLDIGALLFGDLYHVASHHSTAGDGATGLVLRRGYLTFDAEFSERIFGRLRFELNQSGAFETYDFEVDFKDLYLGWKPGRHTLLAGLSPTPTFDLIESVWDFRYLARTPLDLQGVASRDTGVALRGPLNASGSLSYRAMVGAGLEFGNESGDGRKWMGALHWRPAPGWLIDLYADHEKLAGPKDRSTLQAFIARQTERFSWGLQYSDQDREDDPPLELASMFAHLRVGQSGRLVGRVDHLFEPSPRGDDISYLPFDPTATATLFMAGVEWAVADHVFLTPNVVYNRYGRDSQGARPDSDLHLRLTLFLDFE
jgi:hypothetical protein